MSVRHPPSRDLSGPCAVYVIVNPHTRNPFYVGISKYPWGRFQQHRQDRCSAAWEEMELWLRFYPPSHIFKIYKWCKDRDEAYALEYRLVCATRGLLNRDQKKYILYQSKEAA